ncbi:hypothetical protein FRB99_008392, partial [Tulasnella sp. 403]
MPAKTYKYCRPPRRPTDYYTHYERLMNDQDKEMLKIMNDNLDNLLIFAALFSAVDSAFIAITLNLVIPSSTDTTNALLHFLIQRIDNTTTIPSEIYPTPSFPGTSRINCYFCASLAFSLVVALGAIMGKQWLLYYDRVGDVDPLQSMRSWRPLGLEHRGRNLFRKLQGLRRWHLQAILEAGLPSMLQFAVLLFFVGLIDFARSIEPTIGWVTLGIAAASSGAYVITVAAATWDPDCPFQTPMTKTVLPIVYLALLPAFRTARSGCLSVSCFVRLAVHRLSDSKLVAWIGKKSKKWRKFLSSRRPSAPKQSDSGARDQPSIDEMYAPSTEDIQVASWILSTSMDPKALRAAAASLPYLHVPSILTTEYLDSTAISRLIFLFCDANKACLGSKTPSPESLSDLLVYGEALFHVILSSMVEETVRSGTLPPHRLHWWTSYSRSMRLVPYDAYDKPELSNYRKFTQWCLDLPFFYASWKPIGDPEKVPLHFAVIAYDHISLGKCREEDRLGKFLQHAQEIAMVGKNIDIPPSWNIVSITALALTVLPRNCSRTNLEWEAQVRDIRAIWDAYTDDRNLFPNFASACGVYQERVKGNSQVENLDQAYKWLIHSMRTIVEDVDQDALFDSTQWSQVARGCMEVAVVGLQRYSKKEADESILGMVRDCLPMAAKSRYDVPLRDVIRLWTFVMDKDTPPNVLDIVLEGILGTARFQWRGGAVARDDDRDVIDPERMRRLLGLLKEPQETLHPLVLRLLRMAVHEDTVDMILRDDILPLIAGQLIRDASTQEKDVFDATTRLLDGVMELMNESFIQHKRQLHNSNLARALVQQATSQPMNASIVAIALKCWHEFHDRQPVISWRGSHWSVATGGPLLSDSEGAKGTSRDSVWFC